MQPASTSEKAVLSQLDTLPAGQSRPFGSVKVTAGNGYDAASGRRCRTVKFEATGGESSKTRLACRDDTAWFFVPEVFVARPSP